VSARIVLDAGRLDDGTFVMRAPRVGIWSEHPAAGSLLGPGSPAGRLTQLGTAHTLVIPDGVTGEVELTPGRDLAIAAAYGEILFRVRPQAATVTKERGRKTPASAAGKDLKAPTDGVFYRSPAPGEKAYVEVGDRVRAGQAVGLIEVMKTFSPIVYGGPALPEEAEVVAVPAKDGQEVRAGEVLITVR